MQATAVKKFQRHKPFSELAKEAGCSVDSLYRLRDSGHLEVIQTYRGFESTIELLYEAWQKRADVYLESRGVQKPKATTAKTQTRRERAEQAAAALGYEIKK